MIFSIIKLFPINKNGHIQPKINLKWLIIDQNATFGNICKHEKHAKNLYASYLTPFCLHRQKNNFEQNNFKNCFYSIKIENRYRYSL